MSGNRNTRWMAVVFGACCVALLLGSVAGARIVPQKGIAKINLG